MIEKSCENCRFRDVFCSTCRDCRLNVIENKCFPSEWRPRTAAQLCEDYCNNDVNSCKKLIGDMSTGYSFVDPATAQKAMNRIKNVIFNDPATIVFWDDGTKTVVKAQNEPFDPEKGLAMAIAKYFFDNMGYYYDVFKKWLPKEELDPEAESIDENKKSDTEFIFLKDFCERNNITKNKAYGMIKRGEIYAFKNINGKWVVEIPVNSNTVSLT